MSDVKDTKIPENKASQDSQAKPKVGLLVEMTLILLLVGVVFVFVFGMRQVQAEKKREQMLQAKFEQMIPNFDVIAKAAKVEQAKDEFEAYPVDIGLLTLPETINTDKASTKEEFAFALDSDGTYCKVVLVTTKAFGKEGIEVIYDLAKTGREAYEIKDPNPDKKPVIKYDWLP